MCQLLGMNCNVPTDICFSFTGFQARGGITDNNTDGWGISFFEGKGVRQFLDPKPSASSSVAEFVKHYPIKSTNVIAHIRKATHGDTSLENTHPFVRELWGKYWSFAHNGNLKDFTPALNGRFCPVGTTDSETAFCYILQELQKEFQDTAPSVSALGKKLHGLTLRIIEHGNFNFLLSNGEFMLAHCSTNLASIIRKAPFSVANLKDQDMSVDFTAVTTEIDRVAIIATNPLTENETWERHEPGSLLLFVDGEIKERYATKAGTPQCESEAPES